MSMQCLQITATTATCACCLFNVTISSIYEMVYYAPQPLSTKLMYCLSFTAAMTYGLDAMCESRATGELMLWSGVYVTECSLYYGVEFVLRNGVSVMEWSYYCGVEFALWSRVYVREWNFCHGVEFMLRMAFTLRSGVYVTEWRLCYRVEFALRRATCVLWRGT